MNQWLYPAYVGFQRVLFQGLLNFGLSTYLMQWQAVREFLLFLTCLMNHLLSGNGPSCLVPWLCGAPLTTLLKKSGDIRPIAVGEVLRRLVSRLCCLAVRPSLPHIFLPYGQVGFGIPGGLESAIHITCHFVFCHGSDSSLAWLKVDMKMPLKNVVALPFLFMFQRIFQRLVLG